MKNDLVSIIIISQDNDNHVLASIQSVIQQSHSNWELFVVDDKSKHLPLHELLELKKDDPRIHILQNVKESGEAASWNTLYKELKGKWVAFMDAGDIWESTKLEKQIAFMEKHGYVLSYTPFWSSDKNGNKKLIVSGIDKVTRKDMLAYCWPDHRTVMYNMEVIKPIEIKASFPEYDGYALLLILSRYADCYLMPEATTTLKPHQQLFIIQRIKSHFHVIRYTENMDPTMAGLRTLQSVYYAIKKRLWYMKRV